MFKTKIKRHFSAPRMFALVGLCLLVAASMRHPLGAQAVTEGYNADQVIQRGMIVRLKKDDATKVEPVNSDGAEHMHGIVVSANDAPVTIAIDGQRVFIATTGHFDVLVSNQNGTIDQGDYIAVSALSGIGMKAGTKEPYVIGRSLASFDGTKGVVSSSEIKDSNGKTHKIGIGRVSVDIGVAKNPLLKATEPNLPSVLQKAAEAVAGKPVNAVRVYIGMLVFGITTLVAASLLYGGVRSALISIGRNPLSKKSIVRSMLQVIVTGLIVFITGVFGVYLILRL
jgi:hypothetical protein